MNNTKRVFIASFILMALLLSCSDKQMKSSIYVGKWKVVMDNERLVWEFKKNGTIAAYKNGKESKFDKEIKWIFKLDGIVMIDTPEGKYYARIDKNGHLIAIPPKEFQDDNLIFKKIQ